MFRAIHTICISSWTLFGYGLLCIGSALAHCPLVCKTIDKLRMKAFYSCSLCVLQTISDCNESYGLFLHIYLQTYTMSLHYWGISISFGAYSWASVPWLSFSTVTIAQNISNMLWIIHLKIHFYSLYLHYSCHILWVLFKRCSIYLQTSDYFILELLPLLRGL